MTKGSTFVKLLVRIKLCGYWRNVEETTWESQRYKPTAWAEWFAYGGRLPFYFFKEEEP